MIFNLDTQRYLARAPRTALRWGERTRGMIGRRFSPEMDAMVFPLCGAIHTFFMRMRLDVVFLNRESRVVGLHENLGCWRPLVWAPGAVTVLELPVGRIRESGTQMGHQLKLNQILRPEAIAKMRYGGILYHDGM